MSILHPVSEFVRTLDMFNYAFLRGIFRGVLIFFIGYLFLRILSIVIAGLVKKKLSKQSVMIAQKGILYTGMLFVSMVALQQLGVRPSALLGAAGIIGIALGFASQTSVSNIISGLFLIGEKPFEVGDIISVDEKRGVVLSIDLLSIKLRTFDNQFIRIPNEKLIKTDVVNITRFPVRRMDFKLGVAYKEDIRKVLGILKDIAEKNHYILDEPEPFIMFDGFGNSALEITFGVWFVRDEWAKTKTQIMIDIKERFDKEGIEIPFPHVTLYSGSKTGPMPVQLVDAKEKHTVD
jgi:small-conductance mechanosensitive channel